ncbi:unnamed protein product [Sphagnum troendelagicum]|uniref:Uncharacterized protein n=1 Tax=Sphagnum troendelagicum TaxID=128251 RepID=A0ABP0TY68_9BRYO
MIIVSRIFSFLCVISGRDKKKSECRAWILRSLSCFKPLQKRVWRWSFSWQCVSYSALKKNHSHFTMKANYLKVNYLPLPLFCLRVFQGLERKREINRSILSVSLPSIPSTTLHSFSEVKEFLEF